MRSNKVLEALLNVKSEQLGPILRIRTYPKQQCLRFILRSGETLFHDGGSWGEGRVDSVGYFPEKERRDGLGKGIGVGEEGLGELETRIFIMITETRNMSNTLKIPGVIYKSCPEFPVSVVPLPLELQ